MGAYIPIAVLIGVATVLAGVMVGASVFLGPHKPSAAKSTPYECGVTPVGSARERFPIKFYLVAMLFIVFDIETIFLYPWAVNFRSLGYSLKVFNYVEMAIFVVILFVGYFYILGKGALDWDESDAVRAIETPAPGALEPRPRIRYADQGAPVDLGRMPVGPPVPVYGASSQELYQSLPLGSPRPGGSKSVTQ